MISLHAWSNNGYDRIIVSNIDGSNAQTINHTHNTITNSWSFTSTGSRGGIKVAFLSNSSNNNLNINESEGWEFNIESLNQPTTLVNWNVVGTSKYFDLYYSVDNGLSWDMIVTNFHSPSGSYNWNVPNDASCS